MIKHWLTFGMSSADMAGFQDTSRLMTEAFDGDVCYVSPPKPFRAWKRLEGKVLAWTKEERGKWNVLLPPLPIPSKLDPFGFFIRAESALLERQLVGLWGANWRDETAVYITNWTPYYHRLLAKLKPKNLVFDCVDDVLAFPYGWDKERTLEAWRSIAQAGATTAVLSVSPVLQQRLEETLQIEPEVVPNAVDASRFLHTTKECPIELEPYETRVGFAGTLNHWIDFKAILHLATLYPDVSFLLMGKQGHITAADQSEALRKLWDTPNVHLLGAIDYDALPNYLHAMDVLFLPRIQSAASEASNPLKLYEYLAVGKPIVVSGVPLPDDMQNLVYTSSSSQALEDALQVALDEANGRKRSQQRARQNYAKNHTWEQRVEQVLQLLGTN